MTRRTQRERIASLDGEPLGDRPPDLTEQQRAAWHEIIAASPDVLRATDAVFLRACALRLASWRAGLTYDAREMYRWLGNFFMPMRERRRLLFPNRPKRKAMQ